MIIFDEEHKNVLVALGYGSCGIGAPDFPLASGEWGIVIDNNDEGKEVGATLVGPHTLHNAVVISFPTKEQRDAVHEAIFRFKQDENGEWILK